MSGHTRNAGKPSIANTPNVAGMARQANCLQAIPSDTTSRRMWRSPCQNAKWNPTDANTGSRPKKASNASPSTKFNQSVQAPRRAKTKSVTPSPRTIPKRDQANDVEFESAEICGPVHEQVQTSLAVWRYSAGSTASGTNIGSAPR